jgi:CelD/BcsL family acetyltransferase involved in cellulose biosynthesis
MVLAIHEGRPIGIAYGFVWRDTFYSYQGGWDAAWAHLSLGTVLENETIRIARLQGLHCIDFLRGREPYKYRFGGVDKMDESWLVPRGFSGWLIGRKFQGVRLQRALRETWQSHRSNREKASPAMAPTS